MNPTVTSALKDVLYEFSLAQALPDSDLIEAFVRRYPDHAHELTEFAVRVVMDELAHADVPIADTVESDPSVSIAMSRFQNRLYDVGQAELAPVERANPFSSLDRTQIRSLAKALNTNTVFIMKLRDRVIEAKTISAGFCKTVARELGVSIDDLMQHFAAPSQMADGLRFKADGKPTAGQKQTFEDAVSNSGLDQQQQSNLLDL